MLLSNVVDISIYLKNSFNKGLLVFFPQGRHLELLNNKAYPPSYLRILKCFPWKKDQDLGRDCRRIEK